MTLQPFFHAGFFTMHDDTQVARVFEMFQSLKSGMIPVRWVMDLGYGYGYPIFTFYAPFAYYVGALLMFLGFNALLATKLMMILGIVLAGIFMYLLGKEVWGEEGGFVSALLYLFAPYHAVNIYVRGAVAELWGMAFLPLLFYGIWKTYTTSKWRYVMIGSLAFAGIILSHNLTAMMITPFAALPILVMLIKHYLQKDFRSLLPLFCLLIFGILISTFYWLPAIGEMGYTNVRSQISGTGSKYTDHFVCLSQLWNSPWGYAGSAPGCIDGMSYRIGKLHVLFAFLAAGLLYVIYRKRKEKGVLVLGSLIGFLVAVFLTLEQSAFIWHLLSPMSFFQFPWQFLLLVVFFSSFLAGSVIWYAKQILGKKQLILIGMLFITFFGVLFLYGKLFKPQALTQATVSSLTNPKTLRFMVSNISDEYMPVSFKKPTSEKDTPTAKAVIKEGKGTISLSTLLPQKQVFIIHAKTALSLLLNTAPFPAWKTYLDEIEIVHENTSKGISVSIPSGDHQMSLVYTSTKLERIGNVITLTSMLGLLVGIIYLRKKKVVLICLLKSFRWKLLSLSITKKKNLKKAF